MKTVVQRVKTASVLSEGNEVGKINEGFVVLAGVAEDDTESEIELMARKIAALRIFSDEDDKLNLSLVDKGYSVLAVSNFTLCADTRKGNRPSFIKAKEPNEADRLFKLFCEKLAENGVGRVETGVFRTQMEVSLVNDGPITIYLDTDTWRKK